MTYQPMDISDDLSTLPKLPGWVTSERAETLETVTFRSGAALTVLDQLVRNPAYGVPLQLMGNRLALKAATATSKLEGRLAREVDIRDAFHLTQAGEARGPDGDVLAFWRNAARLRLTGHDWGAGVQGLVGAAFADGVLKWIKAGADCAETHGPLAGCVSVMQAVLEVDDRAERIACLLSDVLLARVLDWSMVLPVSARCLSKAVLRDLVEDVQDAGFKVQTNLWMSIADTIRLATDLAARAAALRAVAPKLRAKGSEAAVALFLFEDAVAPSAMLSPTIQGTTIPMTDRAARRFCDRLVELDVARELTGRSTFRLYGIAS